MNVRLAVLDDAHEIGRMWASLVAYHCALDPDLPQAAPHGPRGYARRIAQRLDDHNTRVFVAEHEGVLVGYVLGTIIDVTPDLFETLHSGFIADIYVSETARGQGVGRALVESMKVWFRSRSVTQFEWHVAVHNPTARAFWQAVGGRDLMVRMRAAVD